MSGRVLSHTSSSLSYTRPPSCICTFIVPNLFWTTRWDWCTCSIPNVFLPSPMYSLATNRGIIYLFQPNRLTHPVRNSGNKLRVMPTSALAVKKLTEGRKRLRGTWRVQGLKHYILVCVVLSFPWGRTTRPFPHTQTFIPALNCAF
jgi:hypothetical protein